MIIEILNPINYIQHMSEAEGYELNKVAANWNKIRAHLYARAKDYTTIGLDLIAENIWKDRYLTQTVELHVVAAILVMANYDIKVVEIATINFFPPIMSRFFTQYLSTQEEATKTMSQWFSFRVQEGLFSETRKCWKYIEDSVRFWEYCCTFALSLSTFARRVMKIPGNSVLMERSWSAMNLIMNKSRNSLFAENTDKLMFIYMNERALN